MKGNETLSGHPIRCYQLTGKHALSWDNYTVVYMDQPEHSGLLACVGLSGHAAAMVGPHLGKRIPFASLPTGLQRVVTDDLTEDAA
jgi:hypothetical protein